MFPSVFSKQNAVRCGDAFRILQDALEGIAKRNEAYVRVVSGLCDSNPDLVRIGSKAEVRNQK